jgi:DNA-binding FrmR family transcriptional regulator
LWQTRGFEEATVDAEARKRLRTRVNRIAGQVAGVQRMIEEDRYCVDILHQIAAIRSALDGLGVELLTRHLESCVVGHGTGSEHACAKPLTKEQLLAEVQTALSQFLK